MVRRNEKGVLVRRGSALHVLLSYEGSEALLSPRAVWPVGSAAAGTSLVRLHDRLVVLGPAGARRLHPPKGLLGTGWFRSARSLRVDEYVRSYNDALTADVTVR